jgi:hypothetical protein
VSATWCSWCEGAYDTDHYDEGGMYHRAGVHSVTVQSLAVVDTQPTSNICRAEVVGGR